MKTIKIKLKESSLRTLVRKNSFNCPSSYQFVAIDFDYEKGGIAKPYHANIISCNSWTNYPGVKIWSALNEKINKKEVLSILKQSALENLEYELHFMNSQEYLNDIEYVFEYIEN